MAKHRLVVVVDVVKKKKSHDMTLPTADLRTASSVIEKDIYRKCVD